MSERSVSRAVLATLTGLLLAIAGGASSPSAHAESKPAVSVGDVHVASDASETGDATQELSHALRLALNDELSRVPGLGPMKRPLIVSATLTRLSTERRDERVKASATISLALRRADDQVLFAELRGRASVEEAAGSPASLRRAALQGAVRGAVARLPEVVKRSR